MRLSTFSVLHPPPALAQAVGAVPYDTVDTAEAAALAAGNPHSFLHVSRSEIDLPDGADPHGDRVYAAAAAAFARFQRDGVLLREDSPRLYIYRISIGSHVQTGVVGCCHAEDYDRGVILRHEKTRPDKENDRLRHMLTLRAHTGPIYLTYRDDPAVDRLVAKITAAKPWFTATAEDGAVHAIWPVERDVNLVRTFAQVPCCYIADGHHRAAAAARAAAELRKANPAHTGAEDYNWFMAVLFPATQLRILPYNRCVHDLNGLSPDAFLRRVGDVFTLTEGASPTPARPHTVSMYFQGRWFDLQWDVPAGADCVARLDVSVLQDRLLGPILGIADPRTSPRIEFVGGIRGTEALAKRVAEGRAAVAFSMYPASVTDMLDIADAGQIMPPKSTWFEPKLRSGLLVHTF